jgi:hypothetical protein
MITSGCANDVDSAPPAVTARVGALAWRHISEDLDAHGCAVATGLITAEECTTLTSMYADDRWFRSRVVMARHGFGRGEYKYFTYPLPALIKGLRTLLYPNLAAMANRWSENMGSDVPVPGMKRGRRSNRGSTPVGIPPKISISLYFPKDRRSLGQWKS